MIPEANMEIHDNAHTPPQTITSDTTTAVPRTIADIPGLGPIRVRALQKAGWGSLGALRSADLEILLTVPGLTEIKARHIQKFLEQFTPEDFVIEDTGESGDGVQGAVSLPAPTQATSYDAMAGAAQVVQRATRAMGEVITVLLSPEAPQFRSRFLRVLGQFGQCAESIATDSFHLSNEQQSRAIRRLRRGAKALSELTGADITDRKLQGRVADALEELTAKLGECRLST